MAAAGPGAAGERLLRAFARGLPEDADHVELRRAAGALLRPHVGADLAVWATVDPLTTMWTSCVLDGAPRDEALEAAVFANEYGVPDVLKLADLAAAPRSAQAGSLAGRTAGDPLRSPRFREVLEPRGVSDEFRMVFSDGGAPWGALVLLRSGGRFTAAETARLAALGRPFGGRLRRALLRGAATAPQPDGVLTGLVLCAADGRITEMTPEAAGLLAVVDPREVPQVVAAAVARQRAGAGASGALATADGRWLALHVTALAGSVAVVVERIRPHQLAEIVVRSVGLTPREREVLDQVLAGATTRTAARALALSEWTVQDHLKKVFAKFGVGSRAELLATLFATAYAPLHGTGAQPSPHGHFLPSPG
ncbi:helix-turn-helix transcriptional regulator [Modestobacter sp. NPDC049651]|uniref:helix-turn-helix transcriptional regulator n=1 Tax=unclassified Modestobacter TaxID=2643866 RepID=UPI0034048B0E